MKEPVKLDTWYVYVCVGVAGGVSTPRGMLRGGQAGVVWGSDSRVFT